MDIAGDDIFSIFKKVGVSVDLSKMDNNTLLREYGVDSLDMANIFLEIEEKYSVIIPDEEIDKLNSVNHIITFLLKK